MASSMLLDSHIHLWPETSTSPNHHGWMSPGHFLATRHGISDYNNDLLASAVQLSGFVYVETDRYLPSLIPDINQDAVAEMTKESQTKDLVTLKLQAWADEPLEELRFLRRMVEDTPQDGDGFEPGQGDKLAGCVIWAPFHLPIELFDLYLGMAEQVSGPCLWQKVVGFRYLLQGIKEEERLRNLLESKSWLQNILTLRRGRDGMGRAFDIGVDAHNGGIWQLEAAADMIGRIRELEGDGQNGRVSFVLNHLCKPDLSNSSPASSARWKSAMRRFASYPAVYMKYSGGFNEFSPSATPDDVATLVDRLDFYTGHVLESFGPRRVMFGSDWPVCDVGGPHRGHNWELWRKVVEVSLQKLGVPGTERQFVWWKAACEAYGIDLT
jgi:L-rhamnono-1,4-lactonase